jgi:hypothetical protein
MENKQTVICWIHNDDLSFPVDIDLEKTIGHLKEAIVEKNPHPFRTINPCLLKLYVANIRDTKPARTRFAYQHEEALEGSDQINEHFPRSFPKNTIHFAIGKQHSFILSTHIW